MRLVRTKIGGADMNKVYIRGKGVSEKRARRVMSQVYGNNNFKTCLKRGEVHMYFPDNIYKAQINQFARVLNLSVSFFKTKAILDRD